MTDFLIGFNEPYPSRDPIVKQNRKATDTLIRYEEQSRDPRINAAPFRVQVDAEMTVNASTSDTLGGAQTAGLYRITGYAEVQIADPVSQSLTIVIGFTHKTKALTRTVLVFSGAPMTINDNAGFVVPLETDPGTSISYTLTYASNTPGLGEFLVTLASELVNAQE